jgi:hypothetical protein
LADVALDSLDRQRALSAEIDDGRTTKGGG